MAPAEQEPISGNFSERHIAANWNGLSAREVPEILGSGFGRFDKMYDVSVDTDTPNAHGTPHHMRFRLVPPANDKEFANVAALDANWIWFPETRRLSLTQVVVSEGSDTSWRRRGISSRFLANTLAVMNRLNSREGWFLAGDTHGPRHWLIAGAVPAEMPAHAEDLLGRDAKDYASWSRMSASVRFDVDYPGGGPLKGLSLDLRKQVKAMFDIDNPHAVLRLPEFSRQNPIEGTTILDAVLRTGMKDARKYVAIIRTDDPVQMKHMHEWIRTHPPDPSLNQRSPRRPEPGSSGGSVPGGPPL